MGRIAGIDYGLRRIGLALSDRRRTIATPAGTLNARGNAANDAQLILRWAADNDADTLVVGLPLSMDGTDSVQTTLTRALIEELRRRTPLPVELWDERLTSFQADQLLDAAPLSKAKKKRLRDSLAAQIVLQAYLDAHSAPDGA